MMMRLANVLVCGGNQPTTVSSPLSLSLSAFCHDDRGGVPRAHLAAYESRYGPGAVLIAPGWVSGKASCAPPLPGMLDAPGRNG